MYYGSLNVNDQLTFSVNTHNPTNGMATVADAAPTFHVYKDNSPTPILTGTMATLNSPNTIGFYSAQFMVTGTLFSKSSSYNIYVRAVVAGVTGTMAHSFQIRADVDSINVSNVTGNVNGSVGSVVSPVGINTGTFLDALADKVWDELLSGHLTPDSAGYTLFSRMPTGTVLVGDKTGFYLATPQTFDLIGNISGTMSMVLNVQNPVTAGNVTGSVFGNVNGSVNSVTQPVGIVTGSLILAIADQVWDEAIAGHLSVGSTGRELSDVPTETENADALLKRDMSAVTGEASRSPLNALRFIRNKFSTTTHAGKVTVFKEDDTSEAYQKDVTTDASANPIVEG